jgi:hypothetical protein
MSTVDVTERAVGQDCMVQHHQDDDEAAKLIKFVEPSLRLDQRRRPEYSIRQNARPAPLFRHRIIAQ